MRPRVSYQGLSIRMRAFSLIFLLRDEPFSQWPSALVLQPSAIGRLADLTRGVLERQLRPSSTNWPSGSFLNELALPAGLSQRALPGDTQAAADLPAIGGRRDLAGSPTAPVWRGATGVRADGRHLRRGNDAGRRRLRHRPGAGNAAGRLRTSRHLGAAAGRRPRHRDGLSAVSACGLDRAAREICATRTLRRLTAAGLRGRPGFRLHWR